MDCHLYGKLPINPNVIKPFNPLPPQDLFLATDDSIYIATDDGLKILIE